ncbi:transporter substrate-binding domain-containing protein [Parasphingopyxis sp.]|uniref:transporter substrate-binding domain-containing protein n=1 Tax=Parasphingopyxis sp. TaxID=1920299 RepID=UPI002610C114|nr:transporter substrate-binding domain-containing protein [Parasphingopyxis sp.]
MKFIYTLVIAIWFATPIAASADAFDDIQERGELIVGVSIFAPWTHLDREGEFAGHEIDIANNIASDLGVEARLELYNFDEIFDALANGEIDMIAAGVAMTAERARRFHFSIPYFTTGMTIATGPSVTDEPSAVTDFNTPDMTIAVVEDTLASRITAEMLPDANVISFSTPSGAEATVLLGRADAYVASVPEARIYALRHGDRISLPLSEPLTSSVAGFVVRQDEGRLLHFLNSWVHMREADGFLADRYRHYFDTLDWAVDMMPQ